MSRKYKTSYRSTRGVRRFHVSFDAPITKATRAKVCEDCGGGCEEVMTVARCFRCEGIRRRMAKENKPAQEPQQWSENVLFIAPKAQAELDPRTAEQVALDEWQAETQATREGDYPR